MNKTVNKLVHLGTQGTRAQGRRSLGPGDSRASHSTSQLAALPAANVGTTTNPDCGGLRTHELLRLHGVSSPHPVGSDLGDQISLFRVWRRDLNPGPLTQET